MAQGFLGQNWGFGGEGGFKDKLGGLLGDGGKGLGALTSSPTFNAGMGLLASSQDAAINPFTAALGGLKTGKKGSEADEDRKRLADLREQLAALIQQQQQAAMGDPNTAAEQQAQMSMVPGLPGSGVAPGGMVGGQQTPPPPPSIMDLIQQPQAGAAPGMAPGAPAPAPGAMGGDPLHAQALEMLRQAGEIRPTDADVQNAMQFLRAQQGQ